MSDRVYIFDTTLRDGEQSPGCSMTVPEKLRMAAKLVDLGVDILEAGFPIASEGDFEAVDAVSREYPWVQVAALSRACKLDVERAARSLESYTTRPDDRHPSSAARGGAISHSGKSCHQNGPVAPRASPRTASLARAWRASSDSDGIVCAGPGDSSTSVRCHSRATD